MKEGFPASAEKPVNLDCIIFSREKITAEGVMSGDGHATGIKTYIN